MRSSPVRILNQHVDGAGLISVVVTIGNEGRGVPERETGAYARPLTVAKFLRELADDVERLA